jgi:predicted transcriptional regulator
VRNTVYTTVAEYPGIHLRGLQRELGCAPETVRHHATHDQRICSKRLRGYRRIYPVTVDAAFHNALAALNHGTRGPIITYIHHNPGENTSTIAASLQKPQSTVSRHLNTLTEHNVITVSTRGASRTYRNTDITNQSLTRFGSQILARLTDSFIDTWEQF